MILHGFKNDLVHITERMPPAGSVIKRVYMLDSTPEYYLLNVGFPSGWKREHTKNKLFIEVAQDSTIDRIQGASGAYWAEQPVKVVAAAHWPRRHPANSVTPPTVYFSIDTPKEVNAVAETLAKHLPKADAHMDAATAYFLRKLDIAAMKKEHEQGWCNMVAQKEAPVMRFMRAHIVDPIILVKHLSEP